MHVEGRFPAAAQSVRAARELVRAAIDAANVDVDGERVVLATSELATNAAVHAHDEPFELEVDIDATGVCLSVTDASAAEPVLQALDVEALGGRGVAIVDALSTSWGVQPCARGKRVWCHFAA